MTPYSLRRPPNRRTFVTAVASAALLPALSRRAVATSTFSVGAIDVTVLSDGMLEVGLDRLTTGDVSEARREMGLATDSFEFALNVTLLTVGGKRILIDSGAGNSWIATAGKLSDALPAAGVDPQSIDQVILTHAHPDHLWGMIDDFDELRFPNAKVTIPDAEFDFWMSPEKAEKAGVATTPILGARRVLARLADKLTRMKPDDQVAPGLAYVEADGHTPGQCAVLATSGSEHVLLTADTIFHPLAVAHPEWRPAQDMDGDRAVASRKRMLDIAATKKALVVAYHVATPGVGRIEKSGAGYAWRKA